MISDKQKDKLIEELAAYAHEAWNGWMKYMLRKAATIRHPATVEVNFSIEDFDRWMTQMDTAYKKLPVDQKNSDIDEAKIMFDIMRKHFVNTKK
ncbi:MAG: hypothetical protein V3V84_00680 [Candidatus Bathyarchaeia archaeon]